MEFLDEIETLILFPMDPNCEFYSSDKIPFAIAYQSTVNEAPLLALEENEFIARNQLRSAIIFSGFWLSYCWWLSERYHFDFGRYTTLIRLLFCLVHVLTVWKFFQYVIKIIYRFYRFTRRLRAAIPRHLTVILLSLVLFLLLTLVLHFKKFLREAFAIIDK